MIGYDDPWIAPCGHICSDIISYTMHAKDCRECSAIRWNDLGTPPAEPENDADDRGICYEDD